MIVYLCRVLNTKPLIKVRTVLASTEIILHTFYRYIVNLDCTNASIQHARRVSISAMSIFTTFKAGRVDDAKVIII